MGNDISSERLIQNEETFKNRNITAKEILENLLPNDEFISFICECSNEDCLEHIELSPRLYDKLHSNRKHYIIKIGHDTPSVEKVVAKEDTYEVVEKFVLND